jgi:hypothetical protein
MAPRISFWVALGVCIGFPTKSKGQQERMPFSYTVYLPGLLPSNQKACMAKLDVFVGGGNYEVEIEDRTIGFNLPFEVDQATWLATLGDWGMAVGTVSSARHPSEASTLTSAPSPETPPWMIGVQGPQDGASYAARKAAWIVEHPEAYVQWCEERARAHEHP